MTQKSAAQRNLYIRPSARQRNSRTYIGKFRESEIKDAEEPGFRKKPDETFELETNAQI